MREGKKDLLENQQHEEDLIPSEEKKEESKVKLLKRYP